MSRPERFGAIDFLRGIAILVMIVLHTQSYFLSNKVIHTFWSYGNFVVQIFIFVSAYIFFKKTAVSKPIFTLSYFKDRLLRLMVPYYIFLGVYFGLIYVFEHDKITLPFIRDNILLTGGLDLNWLVVLFVYLTFLLPFVAYVESKSRPLVHGIFLISIASSVVLFFYKPPFHYKLTMWLPWLTIVGTAYYFNLFEKFKKIIPAVSIGALLIFAGTLFYLSNAHRSLVLFDNKYPPNIYFLSYGIMWIGIMMLAYRLFEKIPLVTKGINFFSVYSYTLFFIHYIAMYVIIKTVPYKEFGWFPFFIGVIAISVAGQYGLNVFQSALPKKRK